MCVLALFKALIVEDYQPQEKKLRKARFQMQYWDGGVQEALVYVINNLKVTLPSSGFDQRRGRLATALKGIQKISQI